MSDEIFSLADEIIEVLRERKSITLKELSSEVNGDIKDVKKIVDLLEQQGYLNSEYKMTNRVINWAENGFKDQLTPPLRPGVEYTKEIGEEIGGIESEEKDEIRDIIKKEAEKIEKKMLPKIRKKVEEISKQGQQRQLTGRQHGKQTERELGEFIKITDFEPDFGPKFKSDKEFERSKESAFVISVENDEEDLTDETKISDETKSLYRQLKEQVEDIRKKKAELFELDTKKAEMGIGYDIIKRRMDAEIGVVSKIVEDRENKIGRIKGRIQNLAKTIGGINLNTNRFGVELEGLGDKTERRLQQAINSINSTIERINTIKDTVNFGVSETKDVVSKQRRSIRSLGSSLDKVRVASKETREKISVLREELESSLKSNLEFMKEAWNKANKIDSEIGDLMRVIDGYETRIKEEGEKIGSIKDALKELEKIEQDLKDYKMLHLGALEKMKGDIKDYEGELQDLNKLIEVNFTESYLRELEKIGMEHDKELIKLAGEEYDINKQIDKIKSELNEKINQANKLKDKLRSLLSKGYHKGYSKEGYSKEGYSKGYEAERISEIEDEISEISSIKQWETSLEREHEKTSLEGRIFSAIEQRICSLRHSLREKSTGTGRKLTELLKKKGSEAHFKIINEIDRLSKLLNRLKMKKDGED